MNVTVENLAPCKKLLRVEVETDKVDAAFEEVTRDFQRHARLPGFRAGKAPRHLVIKAYSPQIQDEVRRKLLSESFREALQEQKLDLVGRPEVEETQFGRGQPLQFTATFEIAPEFELPDYRGLPVRREVRIVTPEDVERAVGILLEQRATYVDVAHPVQSGDFVVINYTGTCDGKPITEIAPTARGLTEKKDFWVHVAEGSFIPGFTEQLVGASAGDKRTVTVQYPADFVSSQLAGLTGVYEVEVLQVKEKQLPELNAELAKAYGAETVEELRAMACSDWVVFYHSGAERAAVGLARVSRTSYPDPTAREGDWAAVDLDAVCPLTEPVPLATIKQDAILRHMPLVRHSRLSVSPVSGPQFRRLLALSRTVLPRQ